MRHRTARRCRWWRKRGRPGRSSWCGRTRRAACRCARRCARRNNRAGPAAGWRAGGRCGSHRRRRARWRRPASGCRARSRCERPLRQPSWDLFSTLGEEGVEQQLVSVGLRSKASLILPRKRLRMMQPPRHISAMPPKFSFHLYSFARLAQQHVALRVGDDLRGVERAADVLDERLRRSPSNLACSARSRTLGGGDALVLERGEAAREDRLADQRDRHAESSAQMHGPLAGALLAGGIEDLVDQRRRRPRPSWRRCGGDFDQVAVELALVPLGEHARAARRR